MYKNIKASIIIISIIAFLTLLGGLSYLYLNSIQEIQLIVMKNQDIITVEKEINEIL